MSSAYTWELAHKNRKTLRELHLRATRNPDRLADGDFDLTFPLLEKATIGGHRITRLPAFLERSPKLAELSLWGSESISTLEGIERLPSLQKLWLPDTPGLDLAKELPRLAKLPQLSTLMLGGRSLKVIPESLADLHLLLDLEIQDTPQLDFASLFRHAGKLDGLRRLALVQREYLKLADDSLAPLTNVRELGLKFKIAGIPASIGKMAALEKLEASRCDLPSVPDSLGDLAKLQVLDLESNKLKALPESLARCIELRVLKVSRNRWLKKLPAGIGNLTKLESLDMYWTGVKELPPSIVNCRSLRKLRGAQTLKSVPPGFEELTFDEHDVPKEIARPKLAPVKTEYVDELVLGRDDEALPDDLGDPIQLGIMMRNARGSSPGFSRMRRLEKLYTRTKLQLDWADVFRRLAESPLRDLELEHAGLEALPREIGGLQSLMRLRLDGNALASLPAEIGCLTSLETLDLSQNPLEQLPDAIGELASLKHLALVGTRLTKLPRSMGTLHALENLDLWNVPIESLPEEIGSLPRLFSIRLWRSRLRSVPATLGRIASLRHLTIRSNEPKLDLDEMCHAFAALTLDELVLGDIGSDVVPASIALLRNVKRLELYGTFRSISAEIATLGSLRSIKMNLWQQPPEIRERFKSMLPKGRWRKHRRDEGYERTD